MQTYSVRRGPFSVPQGFEVLQSDGFGAFGDSVLVSVRGTPADSASTPLNVTQAPSSPPSAEAAGSGGAQRLVVQRHKNIVGNPTAALILTKALKLQAALPADFPGVLPIVDAYCTSDCRQDVYVAFPKIIFVVRELAIALQNFHASKIVVGGGFRSDSVGVKTPLVFKNSITLMNFTFTSCEGDLKRVQSVCGMGVEEARDANGILNDRIVFPRNLCYFAPEDVLRFQPTTTTQSDMWGLGCILFELLFRKPVFSAVNANSYLSEVTALLGMPPDPASFIKDPFVLRELQQEASDKKPIPLPLPLSSDASTRQVYTVLHRLLVMDPSKRATAEDLLGMALFTGGTAGTITKPPVITVPPSWKVDVGSAAPGSEEEHNAVMRALYDVVRIV